MLKGFKDFIMQGNVIDLAVAEDLAVNTTPDVVFHFGLRKEF